MEFTERMEAGRDAAAYRRHRGLHTGKSAAGWDYIRRELEAGTWDHHFASAKAAVQFAIRDGARGIPPRGVPRTL